MEQRQSILLVEDERQLAAALDFKLRQAGYSVLTSRLGVQGLELASQQPSPNLIILDVMLPDISGLEVCRRLRENVERRCIPVVFLSAKGEERDRIQGFEAGGDDYIVKPFSTDELLLRLRAVLRRGPLPLPEATSIVEAGPLRIDLSAARCSLFDRELPLTPFEFRLLLALVSRRGRIASRSQLVEDVWGSQGEVTERTVDQLIVRLRRKLEPDDDLIKTARGFGYELRIS